MKHIYLGAIFLLLIFLFGTHLLFSQNDEFNSTVSVPNDLFDYSTNIIKNQENEYSLVLTLQDKNQNTLNQFTGSLAFRINNDGHQLINFIQGEGHYSIEVKRSFIVFTELKVAEFHKVKFSHYFLSGDNYKRTAIPLWASIIPPLLAIFLALIFREVLISLFTGIWVGVFIIHGVHPKLLLTSFLNVVDTYTIGALMDSGHLSVIIFSLMIGGMVTIITRNGGMAGMVAVFSKYARSARSSQFVTWFLGIMIFFDDYANTMIVGNTMRPLTDKFKVSREKLAYIVDSTAAPVAAIALVTTWIGVELGYIKDAFESIHVEQGAYTVFLESLKYSYYPILTLIFIFFLIYMRRDFSLMRTAENKSRGAKVKEEDDAGMDEKKHVNPQWYNAVVPVITMVVVTIAGLFYTGYDSAVWSDQSLNFFKKLAGTIGHPDVDAYKGLIWGSLSGTTMAILLSISQRLLSLGKVMTAMLDGFKTLLPAVVILILAWSLAQVTQDLHTADFLT
ncbi:MAG: hypothetical protein IIA45_13680, partial [Bacteroidetes bacterium]|nr:hypothetical protein [Bacteroidota bacterium]